MKTVELKCILELEDTDWKKVFTIVKNCGIGELYDDEFTCNGKDLQNEWTDNEEPYIDEEIDEECEYCGFLKYFILFYKNIPIGIIKLDVDNAEAEVLIAVSNRYKGKGWGKVLLLMVENELRQLYSYIYCMWADIYDNPASVKLFKSCGYEYNGVDYVKYL